MADTLDELHDFAARLGIPRRAFQDKTSGAHYDVTAQLLELDRMQFFVYETRETIAARNRPIVIITSNNEKELPDAFLRRCFFHYIRFPDRETMERLVDVHYPGLKRMLVREEIGRSA